MTLMEYNTYRKNLKNMEMQVKLTMSTPEVEISNNAKICYATSGDKDITSQLVHGHGHLSALRFAYATFSIKGISVACQNQFVRSSHLDFMVQSKRYVNHLKGEFYFVMPKNITEEQEFEMFTTWENCIRSYEKLLKSGVKKEDARAVLPANTSTNMNATGNLQAWWDFLKLRLNPHAQTEIRELANKIFDELQLKYPKVFTDDVKMELSK